MKYQIQHTFAEGDRVYIDHASPTSMAYYAQNRNKFQCPCLWKREYGIVLHSHGNFIFCKHATEPHRISAFYYQDLRLEED